MRCADILEKHNDEVAAIETWDNGKPYEQAAKVEIPMVVRLFRYYAGNCIIFEFLYHVVIVLFDKLTFFGIFYVFFRLGG